MSDARVGKRAGRLRRAIAAVLATVLAGPVGAAPYRGETAVGAWSSPNTPWSEIGRTAIGAVGQETTAAMLPFERPGEAAMAALPRKVFINYFPFFLVSMDNYPIAEDHWAVHYMQRSGEGGKLAAAGGLTRERPLPVGPWPSPYWREIDEAVDVLRAHAMGADGFSVGLEDIATGPGQGGGTAIGQGVCQAAAHVAPSFKVFAMPDAGVLRGASAEAMARTVASFDSCPARLRLPDGHALLAPFSPDNMPVAYWQDVLNRLRASHDPVDFIPVLLDQGRFEAAFAPISAGLSAWGYRTPPSPARGPVLQAQARPYSPVWMQPITPQDNRPKVAAFFEARNTELFRSAWMEAINGHANYVHLITWNDYGEATEVAPSSGTQFVFYDLSAYYTVWFKTGAPPRILRDAIYYTHRNQIFQPDHPPRPGDKPFQRLGPTPLANDIEMVAMLTAPATLEITIAGKIYRQQAPSGLTAFRAPAAPGRPRFRILRNGATAVEKLSDWTIEAKPDTLSALYYGGSSTRAFVPVPAAVQ